MLHGEDWEGGEFSLKHFCGAGCGRRLRDQRLLLSCLHHSISRGVDYRGEERIICVFQDWGGKVLEDTTWDWGDMGRKGKTGPGRLWKKAGDRTGLSVAFKYHRRAQVFLCAWLAVDTGRVFG